MVDLPGRLQITYIWHKTVWLKGNRRRSGRLYFSPRQREILRQATLNAIDSGARFILDDFEYLANHYHLNDWVSERDYGEAFYAEAIIYQNPSARRAIEHWKKRPGLIYGNTFLFVGRRIYYREKTLRVSSFNSDKHTVTFCLLDKDNPHPRSIGWDKFEQIWP